MNLSFFDQSSESDNLKANLSIFDEDDFENIQVNKANQEKTERNSDQYQGKDKNKNIENKSGKSLRQFYRYKNKIVFKVSDKSQQNYVQSQADKQSNNLFETYIQTSIDNEYKQSNKTIKHSEDPEQAKPLPQTKKKKAVTNDGSSFRHEEFKKRDFLQCLHFISNKTFLGHSQYQILFMFFVFDLIVILGILVFRYRGESQKLLPIPTSIKSKRLIIGNITVQGNYSENFNGIGIFSNNELKFNSSVIIGKSSISKENGIRCSKFISDGILFIGSIIFDYDPPKRQFIIDTQNDTLNIAGHFSASDIYIQDSTELGGLIFTNETCINCITDSTRLPSQLLETDTIYTFKKLNFIPKMQYSMANDDSTFFFGDEISFFCKNNANSNCEKIFSRNLYPVTGENLIKNNFGNHGTIIHAQEFFNNQILRICGQKSDKKTKLLLDEKILFEYKFYPQLAFVIPTFENGEIIQILTTETKIYVYKLNSNNQNEEKIIDCTYGLISKLKAFLNDFGDVVVFAQTEKGVATFRIIPSTFSIDPIKLQFPDLKLFDASNRDGDLIVVAGAKEDGSVWLGRCFDEYCNKIRMIQRKSFQTEKIEFIGVSLNHNDKPTVSLSKGDITQIINCKSFLCEDILDPVWT